MSSKKTDRARQLRLLVFAILAISFFNLVAFKFGSLIFEVSGFQLMLLLLGMFTLAVYLMVWQIVLPLVKCAGKNAKKVFI
ncbi:MAG: hypothetical protein ABIE14_00085 [Patescibacteria group bacterium]